MIALQGVVAAGLDWIGLDWDTATREAGTGCRDF